MKKDEIKLTKKQKDILMNLLLQEMSFCNNQNANIFELLEQYKNDLHAIYNTINESYED